MLYESFLDLQDNIENVVSVATRVYTQQRVNVTDSIRSI